MPPLPNDERVIVEEQKKSQVVAPVTVTRVVESNQNNQATVNTIITTTTTATVPTIPNAEGHIIKKIKIKRTGFDGEDEGLIFLTGTTLLIILLLLAYMYSNGRL
jgi:hypothetical protein